MENLIILKLGGSSITKKSENKFEMNYEILNQSALEIKKAIDENSKLKIILVCGVGPFGHTNVVNYNLNGKIETSEQQQGVEKTKEDCAYVGIETVKALNKVGLAAKLILGTDICVQKARRVFSFNLEEHKKCLEEGIIPITTGTMVPDQELVWSVMSGDQVIAQATKYFSPKKVLMGTDVEGIFTADPKKNKNANLIKNINKKNLDEVLGQCGDSSSIDVTGGMKGKLEKIASTLNGVPAEIFSLFVEKNLENVLLRKEIKSTKVRL
jgi:isopentenyl phosphate kinase